VKMNGIRVFAALALTLLTAGAAGAQGWYAGAFYGTASQDDFDFGTALGTVTTTIEDGAAMGLVVGREVGAFRYEFEWSSRDLDVDDHILGGAALPGPTGEVDASTLFLNGYYNFNANGRVSPYLGAGVGYADVEFGGFGVAPVPAVLSDDDSGFAWQAIAGLGFRLNDNARIFVDYRMIRADGLEVTVTPGAGGVTSEVDAELDSLNAGFRWVF